MFAFYFLVFLSILVLLFYYKQKRIFNKVKHIPGPPMLPFLGNALEFGTNAVDILRNLKRLSKKYGPVVRLCVGWRVFILLSEPKYVVQVFKHSNEVNISDMAKYLLPLFGKGLIQLEGEPWSRRRRILNRFFSSKHLEKYATIINKNCNKLISNLNKIVGHNSTDITHETFNCSLNIICNAVMQVDATENENYIKATEDILDLSINRFLSVLKKFDIFYRFTSDFKLLQKQVKTLDDFYKVVLTKHEMINFSEEEAASKGAIIDELLSMRGEDTLTHEEIRAEMKSFITAGSETVGTSLAFMVYELAKHLNVQEKILEETRHVLGSDKKADVTFEHAHQLKYTECVVKESLRLHSPGQIRPLLLNKETKFDNLTIPGGTDVLLYLGAMHVSPDHFSNPKDFLPERFLFDKSMGNNTFMPFGMGPRMCLGHKFAMLETTIIIAKLIRNFEIFPAQPEHHMILKLECVLKSANGVPISLKFRE